MSNKSDLYKEIYGDYKFHFGDNNTNDNSFIGKGEDNYFINSKNSKFNFYITGEGDDIILIQENANKSNSYDIVEDFDVNYDKINLTYFDKDIKFDDLNIIQDDNKTIIKLTDHQFVYLKDVEATSLTAENFIFKENNTENFSFIFKEKDNRELIGDDRPNIIFLNDGSYGILTGNGGTDLFILKHNEIKNTSLIIRDYNVDEDFLYFTNAESLHFKDMNVQNFPDDINKFYVNTRPFNHCWLEDIDYTKLTKEDFVNINGPFEDFHIHVYS